jgi:hypothetical protein
MNVNEVRVAEDKDFDILKIYLSRNDGWMLEYERGKTAVWTRQTTETDFKMIRVRQHFYNYRWGLIALSEPFLKIRYFGSVTFYRRGF